MNKNSTLELLARLEDFRKKMERGEISEGCADWVVRMCQAMIAQDHYNNRMDWTKELREMEAK